MLQSFTILTKFFKTRYFESEETLKAKKKRKKKKTKTENLSGKPSTNIKHVLIYIVRNYKNMINVPTKYLYHSSLSLQMNGTELLNMWTYYMPMS